MSIFVALGIGAGLVSALLFAAVTANSVPSVLLMYLAPLPILIVALGWHPLLGLLALAVGGVAISLLLGSSSAVVFALGPALAGWALAAAALARRRVGTTASPAGPPPIPYGAGPLLFVVSLLAAFTAFGALAGAAGGDYEEYRAALEGAAAALMRPDRGATLPNVLWMDGPAFIRLMMRLAPALLAGMLVVVLSTNLWLAGRAVAISGRLPRPWPDIPSARMPLAAVPAALLGCLVGRMAGFAGVAGSTLAGALIMAFALQGLAVLHDVSRNRPGRGLILSAAYVMALVLGYVVLPALALLGMTDTALPLRRALGNTLPPTPPPPGPRT